MAKFAVTLEFDTDEVKTRFAEAVRKWRMSEPTSPFDMEAFIEAFKEDVEMFVSSKLSVERTFFDDTLDTGMYDDFINQRS